MLQFKHHAVSSSKMLDVQFGPSARAAFCQHVRHQATVHSSRSSPSTSQSSNQSSRVTCNNIEHRALAYES